MQATPAGCAGSAAACVCACADVCLCVCAVVLHGSERGSLLLDSLRVQHHTAGEGAREHVAKQRVSDLGPSDLVALRTTAVCLDIHTVVTACKRITSQPGHPRRPPRLQTGLAESCCVCDM